MKKAYAEANEVIKEGGYSLAENYLDNFRQDISASPEVIFCHTSRHHSCFP